MVQKSAGFARRARFSRAVDSRRRLVAARGKMSCSVGVCAGLDGRRRAGGVRVEMVMVSRRRGDIAEPGAREGGGDVAVGGFGEPVSGRW